MFNISKEERITIGITLLLKENSIITSLHQMCALLW